MSESTGERWLTVASHPIYEVSDQGRVRNARTHYVLSINKSIKYARVQLKTKDNDRDVLYVHHLVALAFIGARPAGCDVCHNNGNRDDNRAENLRYDTRSNNQKDQLRHGTHRLAARTHCNRGHEFTSENTLMRSGRNESGRRCRTCERERRAARRPCA